MRKLVRMTVLVLSIAAVAEISTPRNLAASSWGVCAYTCQLCWTPEDCPWIGGVIPQDCVPICLA